MEYLSRAAQRRLSSLSRPFVCARCLSRRGSQVLDQPLLSSTLHVKRQTRNLHRSSSLLDQSSSSSSSSAAPGRQSQPQSQFEQQALPLGAFYTDLLSKPLPTSSSSSSSSSSASAQPAPHVSVPTFVQSGDASKEARAARVFGSIEGSGYERRLSDTPDATWRTINGVPVPPRPAEPENCCMSGCVHCVWDDYRDDVEDWAGRLKAVMAKGGSGREVESPPTKSHKVNNAPRAEVQSAAGSMDDDGGGSEALWDAPSTAGGNVEGQELFQGIPVGIREFMATEKRIRERKRERSRVEQQSS